MRDTPSNSPWRLLFAAASVAAASMAVGAAQPVESPKPAAAPSPAATASKPTTAPEQSDRFRSARIQTLLARANFSPGLIDGKPGRKTKIAIEHFQQARSLDVTGEFDDATRAALAEIDPRSTSPSRESWTRTHKITDADLAQITGPIPEDWNERAQLSLSGYIDMPDLLAERGWCSLELLQLLNPSKTLDTLTAGDEVVMPDPSPKPLPKLGKMEIDLGEKLVLGFDDSGVQVFMTHCSIARDVEKRPVGELKVAVVASEPDYTFNPASWPEVTNVESKLRIAPGPRNPVGVAWIGLDRPGYGVHGTVRPQDIGKTGSHGCFRLANWDAARLARAVRVGMPVVIAE